MKNYTVTAKCSKGLTVYSGDIEAINNEEAVNESKSKVLLDQRKKFIWEAVEIESMEWEPESQEVQDAIMESERGIRSII